MIKLSILICSLESRKNQLAALLFSLMRQVEEILYNTTEIINGCIVEVYTFPDVEIIVATDNKQITTGAKRNLLLNMAKGIYISFIDDDDFVYKEYVNEILKGSESDCDCMAIEGIMTTDTKNLIKWRLSKDNPNSTIIENGQKLYLRTTNHIAPVKRTLALKAMFPDKSNAEDKEYSIRLNPYLISEYKIMGPMYHYRYISTNKEYK